MSEYILNALENYNGQTFCYTGGRLCGKTTYATLLAIALKKEEDQSVAAIDFNSSAEFAKNCNQLDIPIITRERLSSLPDYETLNNYQSIVIDLPLSKEVPIVLSGKGSPQKAQELRYTKSKEEYCHKWYQRFFRNTTYALFTLPDNDAQDHGSDALSLLQKFEISTQRTGLVYFRSLSRSGPKVAPRIDLLLQQLSILQTVSPLTSSELYLEAIQDAKHADSCLLERKEYREHYTSILRSTLTHK